MMNEKPVLLILGASSDMGMCFIKKNSHKYRKIWAQYRTCSDEFQELVSANLDIISPIQADFLNIESIQNLIDTININALYPDQIIHFSAAKYKNIRFTKTQWLDYENELYISLRSIILLLHKYIPVMVKQRYGRIIIILSSAVINNPPRFCAPYIITKYALLGLLKELSMEYSGKGVTINGISPSMVETKFLSDIPELVIQQNALNNPIGRNLIPEDIVSTIEFLLSDGANYITGVNIPVTGGVD